MGRSLRPATPSLPCEQYTGSWGMYGLLNWLPTFFNDFYGIQIADLGSYTLLPYIVQGGLGAASGILAGELKGGDKTYVEG